MKTLLRYFSSRYLRRHPFRVILSTMSVALGVALFASVDISNTSTEAAFRDTSKKIGGNAELEVVRSQRAGVDEPVLKLIDSVGGIKAAPVLQLSTTVPGSKGMLLLLGLDFTREASFRLWDVAEGEKPEVNPLLFLGGDVILVSRSFASTLGLKLGSVFKIDTATGPRPVRVGAIFKDAGPAQVFGGAVSVMPLKTAQRLFRRDGTFDRVEVIVSGEVDAAARRLREVLGADYVVRPRPIRDSFLDEAMMRMRMLLGIGVVALLVGLFIIYNSVSISVVERVREIGTWRAIGATRLQIFAVILVEWMILGLLGSAAGLGIGIVLSKLLMGIWTREVNQVTMIVQISRVAVLPRTVMGSLGLGTLTTLFASYFPARAAMSITPIEMLRQGIGAQGATQGYARALVAGLLSIGLSVYLMAGAPEFDGVGLVGGFFAFLGAALLMPQITLWGSRAARPLFLRLFRFLGFLAMDNVSKFPQRTALTVVALAGALAVMVSSSSIVTAIKVRTAGWMEDAFPFDCTVRTSDFAATPFVNATLPEEVPARVESSEAVDFAYGVRTTLEKYGENDVMVFAIDFDRYERMQRLRGRSGVVLPGTLPDLLSGKGVIVSRNFSALYHVQPGKSIDLGSPKGVNRFRVLGTYEEYAWPQGTIFIHRPVFERLWDDPGISYLDIKFKPGVDRSQAQDVLARALNDKHSLFLYDVARLRKLSDDVMDNTLSLLNVQVALSIIIGFFGIVNTLLISVMRRTRELGLLRAVGMTRGQVSAMILIEAIFMAAVGAVLGILLGLAGARWPLAIHVEQVGGYWLPLHFPWSTIGIALGTSLVIGAVASVLPARRAARINVLEAITYE
jgi:putative ABC transport system permease protein